MKTYWEKNKGPKNHYVQIKEDEKRFYIWEDINKSPVTEAGGVCTLQEFLDGQFHNLIEEYFGKTKLKSMLENVRQILEKKA